MKNYLICVILLCFFLSCSKKTNRFVTSDDFNCKPYKYISFETDTTTLGSNSIRYNRKWDITIKKKNDMVEFFFKSKKRLELNTKDFTLLFREFDSRFLLLFECRPNESVATNSHLKIDRLWIFDTNDEQLYYSNLNGKLLSSECHIRTINSESHHVNSPYGLVSIEIEKLKLVLLETTHKEIELDIIKPHNTSSQVKELGIKKNNNELLPLYKFHDGINKVTKARVTEEETYLSLKISLDNDKNVLHKGKKVIHPDELSNNYYYLVEYFGSQIDNNFLIFTPIDKIAYSRSSSHFMCDRDLIYIYDLDENKKYSCVFDFSLKLLSTEYYKWTHEGLTIDFINANDKQLTLKSKNSNEVFNFSISEIKNYKEDKNNSDGLYECEFRGSQEDINKFLGENYIYKGNVKVSLFGNQFIFLDDNRSLMLYNYDSTNQLFQTLILPDISTQLPTDRKYRIKTLNRSNSDILIIIEKESNKRFTQLDGKTIAINLVLNNKKG